jgi:hypothetical protein
MIGTDLLRKRAIPKLKPQQKSGLKEFLHKNVKVSSSNMAKPVVVWELPPVLSSKIKDRTEKRHYEFTDADLEEIVKSGKIPSIKSLMSLLESKEKEGLKEDGHVLDQDQDQKKESNLEVIEELQYDPSRENETFLTGVHITGNLFQEMEEQNNTQESKNEKDQVELTSKYCYPAIEFEEPSLPTGMLGTVRALRQVLKNPGLYWRTSSDAFQSKPNVAKGVSRNTLEDKSDNKLGVIQDNLIREHQGKPSMDELIEMKTVISTVHSRLKDIEGNLMAVMERQDILNAAPKRTAIIQ